MPLSTSDQKLLDKVELTTNERFLLEQLWLKEPSKKKTGSLFSFMAKFVRPAMAAVMILVNLDPHMRPFANMVVTLLWSWAIIVPALMAFILLLLVIMTGTPKGRGELMNRNSISFLKKSNTFFILYNGALTFAIVGGAAAAGYLFTTVFVILAMFISYFCAKSCQSVVRHNLAKAAKQTSEHIGSLRTIEV